MLSNSNYMVYNESNQVYCFFLLFPAAPVCCSSRYGLAFFSCYAFFVVYSLRVNLSVAMVDMLNNTHKSSTNHSGSLCPAHNSPKRPKHNQTVSQKVCGNRIISFRIINVKCDHLVRDKKAHFSVFCFSVICLSLHRRPVCTTGTLRPRVGSWVPSSMVISSHRSLGATWPVAAVPSGCWDLESWEQSFLHF